MTKAQKKTIADYVAKYKLDIVFSPEDECYIVNVPELPGCMTHGDTQEEAVKMAREAIEGCLEVLADHGDSFPVPMAERKFSGQIPLRIDPNLHRDLTLRSDLEGKSLNSFIEEKLKKII